LSCGLRGCVATLNGFAQASNRNHAVSFSIRDKTLTVRNMCNRTHRLPDRKVIERNTTILEWVAIAGRAAGPIAVIDGPGSLVSLLVGPTPRFRRGGRTPNAPDHHLPARPPSPATGR